MRSGVATILVLCGSVTLLATISDEPAQAVAAPGAGQADVRLAIPVRLHHGSFAALGDMRGRRAAGAGSLALAQPPLENRLSAGTTALLRTVRKRMRQVVRNLRYGAGRWSEWLGASVLFLVVALVVPLLGRDNLRTFREEGFMAFMRELSLALAVYVRLLLDSRTPIVGKALLAFAVTYGASGSDLFPDRFSLLSFVDDLVLIMLASRSFTLLCPEPIVEEHALAAAHAREENLQKKLRRRRRAAKDVGGATSATAGPRH